MTTMTPFPDSLVTVDGLRLHCHSSVGANETGLPSLILVHGLGDHSRALPYRWLSAHVNQHGMTTFGFDLRGHGQSQGLRAYTPSWGHLRADLSAFVGLVRSFQRSGPVFLLGLSLGGLLALDYAIDHPSGLAGVIAAAPALDASGASWLVRQLLPLLSRFVPRASLNPGLDLARISRDDEAVRAFTGDPQFQVRTTPRMAAEVLRAIADVQRRAAELRVPLLLLHGDADTIARPSGTEAFFAQVGALDKSLRLYPGGYHNLFIDRNRAEVFDDITGWLRRHG